MPLGFRMENRQTIPPDVGYAWVIVTAGVLMQACVAGVPGSFGVFLDYYATETFPGEKISRLALIGTVFPFVTGTGSMVSGRLCDKLGARVCILAGALLTSGSLVLASFGTQVWHLVLTQGAMFGVGGALVYVPATVIVAEWFEKRRGLAIGIAAAGGGVGGAAFAQLNSRLLPELGYARTLRCNGAILLLLLLVSAGLVRQRVPKVGASSGSGFSKSLVLNGRFAWFAVACLFGGTAYLIPLHYAIRYASSLNMSLAEGGYILLAMNLGSGVGRVAAGLLGDCIGLLRSYLLTLALATLVGGLWLFATSFGGLLVFGVLYGIVSGGYAGGFGATCGVLFGKFNGMLG